MTNNRQLTITTANTRKATVWARTNIQVYELVQRLSTPVRGAEPYDGYMKLPKARQDELKDTGGFVGGTFSGTRRKANEMLSRSVITLDLDAIPAGQTEEVLRRVDGLTCFAIVYSTRKHAPWAPRLRVVVVLDEDCTADEYEPIARKLAQMIGIEWCDPTTFEASRLMYWPSACADGEYIFWWCDKPFLSRQGMLALYTDWRDATKWPVVPGHEDVARKTADKAQNPTEKKGIVGAFCKVYGVTRALEELIPGTYIATDIQDRYTYAPAATFGGALVYDDLFLFSHHASDPVCNQLVNAFDLVRIHKFGSMDDDLKPGTPINRMPSFAAMCEFAANVPEIKQIALADRASAADVFDAVTTTDDNTAWLQDIRMSGDKVEKSRDNLLRILDNDTNLKGKIITDKFSDQGLVREKLPWDANFKKERRWDDSDDAGARWYFELFYGIEAPTKLSDAILLTGKKNAVNVVQDYLESVTWDGVPRIDTMLTDYLGVVDNVYTRAVMSKTMIAACARAVVGGVKYDNVPILVGDQGVGKTTLVTRLGKDWYSGSVTTFGDKTAEERIQGVWIVELGELAALSKQETELVKQFISKTADDFRVPYGRHVTSHPRRCVFIGTTNSHQFLKDTTGNRRFLPVLCDEVARPKGDRAVFEIPESEIDQMWAEAYFRWRIGESLLIPFEANKIALSMQQKFEVDNPLLGQIIEHLNKPVVSGWHNLSWDVRVNYLKDVPDVVTTELSKLPRIPRDYVHPKEIFYEMMHGRDREPDRPTLNTIREALDKVEGWERIGKPRRFGILGPQKAGYKRNGVADDVRE